MLCGVKTEAVNTTVDTFLEQTESPLLNITVACVQIRHTEMVLRDVVPVVVVCTDIVRVIIIRVFEIALNAAVELAVCAAVVAVVGEVVSYDINNYLDVVFFRLCTQ